MRVAIANVLAFGVAVQLSVVPSFEPLEPSTLNAAGTFVNAFADFDGDGNVDLFIGFTGGEPNRLYRNDGKRFVDVAGQLGVADKRATRAAAWGDFDADGDPDLLVGFAPKEGPVLRLYRNEGSRFVDVTAEAGLLVEGGAVRQLAWVDFDGDGDLDLFVAFRDRPNALYRNDGRGRFVDVARELGLADPRRTVGGVWFDYDQDGDLDLYIGNMDGDANGLYRNDGGRFTDVAEAAGVVWGGRKPADPANGTVTPCIGDVDNDGRLDILTANYGTPGLFLNKGNGRFEDVSIQWGMAIDGRYDTCVFSDFDNDGRLDVYLNGTVTGGVRYPGYLLRNRGSRFEDVTPEQIKTIPADHGAQWVDVDRDGAVDLALTGMGKTAIPLILRNMLPAETARRSMSVRVVNDRGLALQAGAEVRLYASGTRRLIGTRLVDSGSGYNSQNDIPVHFGLPSAEPVDIEIVWPMGGRRVTVREESVDPKDYVGRAVVIRLPNMR
jgi:hypothetical protein